MLKNLFTDKGNFSKKAYKDFFNHVAKNKVNKYTIKSISKDSKNIIVTIHKKIDDKVIVNLCKPIGIKSNVISQILNTRNNTFEITYYVNYEELKNEQQILEYYNRTNK